MAAIASGASVLLALVVAAAGAISAAGAIRPRRHIKDARPPAQGGTELLAVIESRMVGLARGAAKTARSSRPLFLEYEAVVLQQFPLEADLVGADARGEREPEVRAGEPARENV